MRQHLAGAVLGATLATAGFGGHHFFTGPDAAGEYTALVDQLAVDEGFRGYQYPDTRGRPTIAYGILLPLTHDEGRMLLTGRLDRNGEALASGWKPWKLAGPKVRSALLRMSFQLGPAGVLGFHDMLAAIDHGDTEAAVKAALASDWDEETPRRAELVVAALRGKGP